MQNTTLISIICGQKKHEVEEYSGCDRKALDKLGDSHCSGAREAALEVDGDGVEKRRSSEQIGDHFHLISAPLEVPEFHFQQVLSYAVMLVSQIVDVEDMLHLICCVSRDKELK